MNLTRNAQIWLPGLLKSRIRAVFSNSPKRVWVMIGDHYEPLWGKADEKTGAGRVDQWVKAWPTIAERYRDSAGRRPKYTFFYPEEEYCPRYLEALAGLVYHGIGDVEVHIHHNGEGEQNFVDRISSFTETLVNRHGLLRRLNGKPAFGFIHGNWALDNSRQDGCWCGLNNEITLLMKLGCYADFTEPSAPNGTQVHMVNTIYWAEDDPQRPKSHDWGIPVEVGSPDHPNDLLMIPGPLGVRMPSLGRWMPRLDTGEIAGYDVPTVQRIRLWLDVAPRLGDDLFIKLYAHGTQERNSSVLLSGGLDELFQGLIKETEHRGLDLYFASAWDVRQAVEAVRRRESSVAAVVHDAVAVAER